MKENREALIQYRISRAYETWEDAQILAKQNRWNSTVNRLYYAAFYAVMALLLHSGRHPTTHKGTKSNFHQYFINTDLFDISFGQMYSQLFTWRQKGDYDDLFDFDEAKVMPYFEPVEKLIKVVEKYITDNPQS